jgi:hypothetical protein
LAAACVIVVDEGKDAAHWEGAKLALTSCFIEVIGRQEAALNRARHALTGLFVQITWRVTKPYIAMETFAEIEIKV